MSETNANDDVGKISEKLKRLAVDCNRSTSELHEKKVRAEKLRHGIDQGQSKLSEIQQMICVLKSKRGKLTFTEPPPVLDKNELIIKLGTTVEIVNWYTCFSSRFPKLKQSQEPKQRGANVQEYDSEKIGTVAYLQRSGYCWNSVNKVHFITDSGFETWQLSTNLAVYNAERGDLDNKAGTREDSFHESRSK